MPLSQASTQRELVSSSSNDTTSSVALCSSDALQGVTFGQQTHSACAAASGYSFFLITQAPTDQQLTKMCAVDACKSTVENIEAACPEECALSSNANALRLYRDVLTPVSTRCGFGSTSNSEADSGPLTSAANDGSSNGNSVQTTTSADESSGLGVGVIISLVVGAMVCVLLVALAVYRHKHRRKDGAPGKRDDQIYENNQDQPYLESAGTFEEADDFISQRDYDEFAAIAVSSKVSSGVSRASTASSKQSFGSYGESGMRGSLTVDSAGIQLDDPLLAPLRIRFDQVHIGQLIRKDAFVEVYQGKFKSSPVAIRKLVPERRHNLKEVERFLDETKTMASLHHERILGFVGIAWETLMLDLCSVSEYATGGDLRSLLSRYAAERHAVGFSLDKIKIAVHIAEALSYLHSQQPVVLHRNLRPESVLLTHSFDAVLMDVGISRASSTDSLVYVAPNVLRGEQYDQKADVYAFGVLLAEIDTHQLRPGASITFSDNADPDMVDIGQSCIAQDPRDRPTAAELASRLSDVYKGYVAFV